MLQQDSPVIHTTLALSDPKRAAADAAGGIRMKLLYLKQTVELLQLLDAKGRLGHHRSNLHVRINTHTHTHDFTNTASDLCAKLLQLLKLLIFPKNSAVTSPTTLLLAVSSSD